MNKADKTGLQLNGKTGDGLAENRSKCVNLISFGEKGGIISVL